MERRFSDRQVKTVKVTVPETDDATPENEKSAGELELWYYKDWLADEESTLALLTAETGTGYGDGTCVAWVDFLLDVMKAQGLDGEDEEDQDKNRGS